MVFLLLGFFHEMVYQHLRFSFQAGIISFPSIDAGVILEIRATSLLSLLDASKVRCNFHVLQTFSPKQDDA